MWLVELWLLLGWIDMAMEGLSSALAAFGVFALHGC